MREINPPALEYEETFSAILKRAGALNSEIKRNDKMNVQKALEIGRMLLRARPMAAVGEWQGALGAQGMTSQRASEFMRGAEAPMEAQNDWQSIAEMRRWLKEQDQPPAQEGIPTGGDTVQEQEVIPATPERPKPVDSVAGMAPPPKCFSIRCERCERKGLSGANCFDCIEKRREAVPAREDRQPGDDDEESIGPTATIQDAMNVPLPSGQTPANVKKRLCPTCNRPI